MIDIDKFTEKVVDDIFFLLTEEETKTYVRAYLLEARNEGLEEAQAMGSVVYHMRKALTECVESLDAIMDDVPSEMFLDHKKVLWESYDVLKKYAVKSVKVGGAQE